MSDDVRAGYVAYTDEGHHVVFFSSPTRARSEFSNSLGTLIDRYSGVLDLPSSIGFAARGRGFRRDFISTESLSAYIYSALVGVSEPNTNRRCAFLSFGVLGAQSKFGPDIELGAELTKFLGDLAKRVTHDGRFIENTDYIHEIDKWLKRNKSGLSWLPLMSPLGTGSGLYLNSSRGDTIYVTESSIQLERVFDKICASEGSPDSFFLFPRQAISVESAKQSGLRVLSWPLESSSGPRNATREILRSALGDKTSHPVDVASTGGYVADVNNNPTRMMTHHAGVDEADLGSTNRFSSSSSGLPPDDLLSADNDAQEQLVELHSRMRIERWLFSLALVLSLTLVLVLAFNLLFRVDQLVANSTPEQNNDVKLNGEILDVKPSDPNENELQLRDYQTGDYVPISFNAQIGIQQVCKPPRDNKTNYLDDCINSFRLNSGFTFLKDAEFRITRQMCNDLNEQPGKKHFECSVSEPKPDWYAEQ